MDESDDIIGLGDDGENDYVVNKDDKLINLESLVPVSLCFTKHNPLNVLLILKYYIATIRRKC